MRYALPTFPHTYLKDQASISFVMFIISGAGRILSDKFGDRALYEDALLQMLLDIHAYILCGATLLMWTAGAELKGRKHQNASLLGMNPPSLQSQLNSLAELEASYKPMRLTKLVLPAQINCSLFKSWNYCRLFEIPFHVPMFTMFTCWFQVGSPGGAPFLIILFGEHTMSANEKDEWCDRRNPYGISIIYRGKIHVSKHLNFGWGINLSNAFHNEAH